ncbi:hypothetical protein RHO13_09210 [Orbus wheelerorum]|uniref:hypothetical protein n=1 Tax=Orbus wheelerorum TaxID=3074111 RepID=UPI00370D7765
MKKIFNYAEILRIKTIQKMAVGDHNINSLILSADWLGAFFTEPIPKYRFK